MTRRTRLTEVQAELLTLAKAVLDTSVAQAQAEFNRRQKVVLGDMDVPSDATGTFERLADGSVEFVEIPSEESAA